MQNTRVRNLFSTILGAGVVAGGLVLSSCEDEFTEQDAIKAQQETLMALEAQNDSLNRVGAKINYTVTVAAAGQGNTTNGRTEAANSAEGATVTVVQAGKTYTETAGKGGVATFIGLMRGQAVVTVEAEDHTTVTYTTTLGSNGAQENNVGTLIPVFPLTVEAGATMVSGKAWAELDATNDMPEEAAGAKVRATVNATTALEKYLPVKTNNYSYETVYGEVETATYDGFMQEAIVGEDGTYSMIIPNGNGADGQGFSPTVQFLPYVAKQKYVELQDGKAVIVEKDVQFGEGINSTNHINEIASVYAEIEAPTGKAEGFAVKAELAAQDLTNNTFVQTADGTGYKQGDEFELSADKDGKKGIITVNAIGANGEISSYSYVSNGAMYTEKPTITAKAGVTGTGGMFEARNFETMYNVVIDNPGTGYWVKPAVKVVYTDKATGTTVRNAFKSILVGEIKDGQVGKKGEVIYENLSSTTAPTFGNVVNPKAKQAIVKSVSIDADGSITGVSFEEEGEGYLTSPKVMFKDASGNEVSAAGVAVLEGSSIDDIAITNPGSGFAQNINDTEHDVLDEVPTTSSSPILKPGTTNVGVNFYYGTGQVQ